MTGLRIAQVDVNTVLGILFVFPFGLQNELLQNIVVTSDNAVKVFVNPSSPRFEGMSRIYLIFKSHP